MVKKERLKFFSKNIGAPHGIRTSKKWRGWTQSSCHVLALNKKEKSLLGPEGKRMSMFE